MWNGLIRIFFLFFFSISVKLYISETPCYVAIKLLAKNFLGSHLKCQLSQLLPQLKQRKVGLTCCSNVCEWFSMLPTTKHFHIQEHFSLFSFRACKYLTVFPPEDHQQLYPFQLKQVFLVSCCCKHRGTIRLCPRLRLAPAHTQFASKVTRGLEHVQWSYRSEKGTEISFCFCLILCPYASFG